MIRIVLIDDHAVVRTGYRRLLSAEADFEVVGEAVSADEANALVQRSQPDVALVDLNLKGSSGLEAIRGMLARKPGLRVLVLSIPDWGVTPFARRELRSPRRIARELDAYNAVARDACEAQGVAFVDITGISRDGGDAAAMLAEDGLHPSAAMYARWTAEALPVARGLLAEA